MNIKRRVFKPWEIGGFEWELHIALYGEVFVEDDLGGLYRHWQQHPGYEDKETNEQKGSHDH